MRFAPTLTLFAALFVALATPARAAELECPQGPPTVEGLTAFREATAQALTTSGVNRSKVAAKITQCFPAAVPACVQRALDYAQRSDIGSSSDDVTPENSAEKRPPDELLLGNANGLEYQLPETIEQIAAQRGWPAVRYKSRHAGGFDRETPSLLMVVVPGDKVTPPVDYDRWLNFAIPADEDDQALNPVPQAKVPGPEDYAAELAGGKELPRTFTMVTLTKKQGASPGKVWFQKFFRDASGANVFRAESNSSVDGCYTCHPNGLRAISPLGYHVRAGEAQMPPLEWNAVKLINDMMDEGAGMKAVSWREAGGKPLLRPAAVGPVFGPKTPLNGKSRTEEFIKACTTSRKHISVTDIFGRAPGEKNVYKLSATPSVRWEKVAESMKCESCHNNKARGALNERTDQSQIDFKILVDQSMPLGLHNNPLDQENGAPDTPVQDELTADERMALANCLKAEFELELAETAKWLTQSQCQ